MEEDPSSEWEIMNYYSPPLEDGETEESNLGWIINTGLSLGKNLVITGVVISSVPIILPPIVVISALGFAVSVPFGVAFASYACSEKLMSKLLPSPTPSQMVDYYDTDWPEYEDEQLQISIEKEEKEQREAMKDGVEMRIELVDEDLRDGIRNEQDSFASPDEFTNKIGYLDVYECIEGKDDLFLDNVEDGGLNEEGMYQHSSEHKEDETPSPNVEVMGTGIEGSTGDDLSFTLPMLEVQTENFMENDGAKNVANRQGRENISEDKNENVEEVVSEMKEKKHQTVSKGKNSSKDGEKREKRKALTALKFPGKRKHPEGDMRREKLSGQKMDSLEETKTSSENNLNSRRVMEGMFGQGEKLRAEEVVQETSTDEVGDMSSEKEHASKKECIMPGGEDSGKLQSDYSGLLLNGDVGNIGSSLEREQKSVGLKEMLEGQSLKDGVVCDVISEMNEETDTSPGVLAMETAEWMVTNDRGVDNKTEQGTVVFYNDPGVTENYDQLRMKSDDGEYSSEVAALTGMPDLRRDEEIPAELKEEDDASAVSSGLHSDEKSSRDEKIWEKIEAIRVIVGLKAPRRPSYFEEVKALYLFTGIEPPLSSSSVADTSDLAEFYEKLYFLMSVIGLK